MTWKDVSSYSRDEKDRTPKSWQWKANGTHLVVTHHIHYPGEWVMTFEPFIRMKVIGKIGDDIEEIKKDALEEARFSAETLLRHLDDPRF